MPDTSWNLYSSNEEAWEAMLKDCSQAKKTICLEQFIFNVSGIGQKFIDICTERAKNGVRVRLLWDAQGSFTFFGTNMAAELQKSGIELIFWKNLIPGYFNVPNYRSWFLRNHRRTLTIDGKIGYTGSICIDEKLMNWRDTNVRLEGAVVLEMENAFARMWGRAKKERPLPPRLHIKDHQFRYITNYPSPGRRHIYTELVRAIRHSDSHIYITTPYFVPTLILAHALRSAAKRGVDVRIILPEKSNFYAVDIGARSYFTSLLESGARIFLYRGNFIYSKTAIVDGNWSTVGSLNLDSVSLLYNFEANIVTRDPGFAKELESHFKKDTKDSVEIDPQEWPKRFFVEKIPEILIRLVRKFL